MKKKFWGVLGVLAFFALSGVCQALPTTVLDTTWAKTQSPYNKWYSGDTAIGGATYDTKRIEVGQMGGDLVFSLYTGYSGYDSLTLSNGSTVYTYLADLALDTDGDGLYDHGIVLQDHGSWVNGVSSGNDLGVGLYSVTAWNTSSDFMSPYGSAIYYGKEWAETQGGATQDSVVAIQSVVNDSPVFAEVSEYTDGVWTVKIALDSLGLTGGDLGIFWGTATCSNDPIAGKVHVPEPGTIMFLGSLLLGLGIVGRKELNRRV